MPLDTSVPSVLGRMIVYDALLDRLLPACLCVEDGRGLLCELDVLFVAPGAKAGAEVPDMAVFALDENVVPDEPFSFFAVARIEVELLLVLEAARVSSDQLKAAVLLTLELPSPCWIYPATPSDDVSIDLVEELLRQP